MGYTSVDMVESAEMIEHALPKTYCSLRVSAAMPHAKLQSTGLRALIILSACQTAVVLALILPAPHSAQEIVVVSKVQGLNHLRQGFTERRSISWSNGERRSVRPRCSVDRTMENDAGSNKCTETPISLSFLAQIRQMR